MRRFRFFIPKIVLVGVFSIFLCVPLAHATLYAPGETLDPSCAPTDVDCGVAAPVETGIAGQFPYYSSDGSTASATSTLTLLSSGYFGIATTSPYAQLSVGGDIVIGAKIAGGTLGDLFLPKLGTAAGSFLAVDATGKVIATSTPSGSGLGTVTSVGISAPSFLTVSGSPITTSGTLTLSYSGTALPLANGGTGLTSFAGNQILYTNAAGTALLQVATSSSSFSIGGNAATATALQTPRTINGTSFDGSANITINAASSTLLSDTNVFTQLQRFNGNASTTELTVSGNAYLNNVVAGSWNGSTISVAYGGTGSTTLTGILKGNGLSGIQTAVAGTDYQLPITLTTTGSSGAATFTNNVLNIPQYTGGGSSASSTLLVDNNTFSGTNTFSSPLTIGSGTGTSTVNGNIGITGNIVPSADNTYSLGSSLYQWKDVHIGPGSLYVNGKKVLEDVSNTMTFSTDVGQNLSITTSGIGSIDTNASGSGNVNLTTGTGNINFTTTSGNINFLQGGSLNLGTVASGIWHGTALTVPYGGTGSTTLSGILKGNGTGNVLSAIPGTDYQTPITLTTSGTSGAATFSNGTLNIPQYTSGTSASSTLLSDNNAFSGNNSFSALPSLPLTAGYILSGSSSNIAQATSSIFVANSGLVGIGTATPKTRAQVYGTLTVDPTGQSLNSYSEGIRIGSASTGYSIVTYGANTGAASGSQANQWWAGKDGRDNGFNIYGASPGDAFHILSTGSVGIGTTNPGATLDVIRTTNGQGAIWNENLSAGTGAYTAYFAMGSTGTSDNLGMYKIGGGFTTSGLYQANDSAIVNNSAATRGRLLIMNAVAQPIIFATGGTATANERMRIDSTGNVGVGTNDTTELANHRLVIAKDVTYPSDVTNSQLSLNGATTPAKQMALGYDTNGNGFGFIAAGYRSVAWTNLVLQPSGGSVGIGTSSPLSPLSVYGNALLEGSNRYLNFGTATGTNGYGFRDNAGVLEFKNSGGAWNEVSVATTGPAFSVDKGGTNQTVTAGAATLLTWSNESFDTNNNFSGNRFQPTVPGKYLITGTVDVTSSASGQYVISMIYKNGAIATRNTSWSSSGGSSIQATASIVLDMNGSTDYVELYGQTALTTIVGTAALTNFSGTMIAPVSATGGGITNNGSASYLVDTTDKFGIGTSSPLAFLTVNGTDSTSNLFQIATSTNPNVLTITSNGNMGLGTSTPSAKLTVDGGLFLEGTSNYLNFGTLTGSSGYGFRDNAGTIEFSNLGGSWNQVSVATTGPAFSVNKNGTNQTVTSAVTTKLTWSTKSFDTNNNFDLTNNRFTPTVPGKYLVTLTARCTNSSNYCAPAIYKNGVNYTWVPINGAGGSGIVTTLVDMNGTTDYLEAEIYAVGTTISGVIYETQFSGTMIAPANAGSGGGIATNGTASYVIDNADNFGVGTSSPYAKFAVQATQSQTNPVFEIASSSTATKYLLVDSSGNVGIGTSSPWRTLSVNGTVALNGLTGSSGAGSICLSSSNELVYNSGSDSCLPSLRATKHDINNLSLSATSTIEALNPVSFIYNNDVSSTTRYGFIAEDSAAIDPHLATYDANGNISGIDDRAMLAVVVKALQNVLGTLSNYAQSMTTAVINATTGNFTHVKTQDICVGSTCITETQLKAILENNGQTATASWDISTDATDTASSTATEAMSTVDTEISTTTPDIATSTPPVDELPAASGDATSTTSTEIIDAGNTDATAGSSTTDDSPASAPADETTVSTSETDSSPQQTDAASTTAQ